MSKPLVVLADPDGGYLAPLECRFLEELGDTIELEVITTDAYWAEFTSQPHDIEALLLAEEWYDQQHLDRLNVARLFLLTEERQRDGSKTHNLSASYTFKYGSLDALFGRALVECPRLAPKEGVQASRAILFCSPVGGAGTTTLALGCASCLSAMYKRVLYVDAEYVQTFATYLTGARLAPDAMARDMARTDGDAYRNVERYLAADAFGYLPPLRSGLAAFGVDFGFFERFVRGAVASGRYDYVIVDADGSFDEAKARLFSLADQVVVPVTQDVHALHKLVRLFDNIDASDAERYHVVCNKYVKGAASAFTNDAGGAQIVLDGYVEHDDAIPAMDLRALGEVPGVRRLVRSLG